MDQRKNIHWLELSPREALVWTGLLLLVCGLAWWSHGLTRSGAEVRVQALHSPHAEPAGSEIRARIDLNRATASELELLPGIGATRARAILRERDKRGRFRSLHDLEDIPGLAPALLRKLEPLIAIQD